MIVILRGTNKIDIDTTYNSWNADGGRLLNLTSTQVSPANNLQNLTYDYDSVGNINTIIDSLSGPQTQSFTYDALDRLLSSDVTGGDNGLYSETYSYNGTTGNLSSKAGVNYTTYDANHKHAVTNLSNGNSYAYDANGNMTSRNVGSDSFTLAYDTENRLVSVTGAAKASYSNHADGKQVIGTVNGVTTYYMGQHYEKKSGVDETTLGWITTKPTKDSTALLSHYYAGTRSRYLLSPATGLRKAPINPPQFTNNPAPSRTKPMPITDMEVLNASA